MREYLLKDPHSGPRHLDRTPKIFTEGERDRKVTLLRTTAWGGRVGPAP